MHLLPTDFTLLILVRPCRSGMGLRQHRSRLILPRKNYRCSNREPTVSAQLLFSRSIPFTMENGPIQYESAYRLALARANHSFDLPANDSVINGESSQCLRFARLCAYLRKREPMRNPWKLDFSFSTQSTRTGSGALRSPPSWRQVSKCDCDLKPSRENP